MKIILNDKEKKKVNKLFNTNENNIIKAESIFYDLDNNIIDDAIKLDIEEYNNNPYNTNIFLSNEVKFKDYKLVYQVIKSYSPFLYLDNEVDENFNEITNLGYFENDYKHLCLMHKDSIWMLISPHEINSMEKAINEANGNVLVLGLGLGYFPYMISLKENVTKITIIENDSNIIKLFKENILNQFEQKDKIEIVNDDAFNYLKKQDKYDFAFIDLWHDCDDGLKMYVKCLKLVHIRASYWIENALLIYGRRLLINLLYEKINNIEANYDKEENYYDHLINDFNSQLISYEIRNYQDLKELLSNDSIKKLLKNSK